MGNIASKSDVGTWTYHGTKKHAVTSAAGNTFTYDDNGNQITRNANDVTWTSYNYPSRVENGTRYHDFFYDANRQRWKQVYYNGSANETTIFVGGILEKHTAGSLTEYRHYIQVGRQAVALYTRPSSGSITTQYLHLDHLGSIAEVTNASGAVDVSENFDAFGQRRDATDWSGAPASGVLTTIASVSQRGYTFHTNLESSSLIHMNGRIADGLTGRFLSADPYVTNPGGTQFFNRYSYVNNNPLTYTDPSGFFCVEDLFQQAVCSFVLDKVFDFLGSLFGSNKKPPPPPKGCWQSASGCWGKAGSSKLYDIVKDVLGLPGKSMVNEHESLILYFQDPGNAKISIDRDRVVQSAGELQDYEMPLSSRVQEMLEDDCFRRAVRVARSRIISAMQRNAKNPGSRYELPNPQYKYTTGAILLPAGWWSRLTNLDTYRSIPGNKGVATGEISTDVAEGNMASTGAMHGQPTKINDAIAVVIVIAPAESPADLHAYRETFLQHDPIFPVIIFDRRRTYVIEGEAGPYEIGGF